MDTSEALPRLYGRLRMVFGLGGIGAQTYYLGLHVLQRMAKHKSLEVAATWGEFANQIVCIDGYPAAPAMLVDHYGFYGALQQLQEVVGLFSDLTSARIEEAITETQHGLTPGHFTAEPGVDSHIIGPATLLLFVYRDWAGSFSEPGYVSNKIGDSERVRMPAAVLKLRSNHRI